MIISWLLDRMSDFGESPALIWADEPVSYSALVSLVDRWIEKLDAFGVVEGAVVACEGDYSPESCSLLIALVCRRAIAVPLSGAVATEREALLEISEAEFLIELDDRDLPTLTRLEVTASNPLTLGLREKREPGLIVFSSGSTGEVKAALHEFQPLLEKFRVQRHRLRTLSFLLLDHLGGINTLFYTLANGGTLTCVPMRNPFEIASAIERHRIELLPTSPTFLNMLLMSGAHENHDLSSLKVISYGTEVMPEATLKMICEAFPQAKVQQTYGLTEVGVLRSRSEENGSLFMRVGGEGFETKVVDSELWIRARSAMVGYLNAPSPFDSEGWLNTHDQVEVRGEFLHILGRKSDIINVGGQKVYPAEVESVLMDLENVVSATVYGMPSPVTGSIVAARIQLRESEERRDVTRRVKKFCGEKLASYKVPRVVELVGTAAVGARFKKVRPRSA